MSEFQTGLVLIGALAIVGVIAFNKWQERRARREAQETFSSRHADILMEDGSAGRRAAVGSERGERIEPEFAPPPAIAPRLAAGAADLALPDVRADYVIELHADEAVAAGALQEHWSAAQHRFAGRTSFAAWTEGEWTALPHGGRLEKVRIAFQMVSRAGVVTEGELLEFRSAVETMAAKLGVSVVAPEMREALDAARELDGVCAEADIQIAFHVIAAAGSHLPGTKLRAAAEAAGLVLEPDGRFEMRDEAGRALYALADREGNRFAAATMKDAMPRAVTLSMDVPRAPDTQRTFEAMVRFGRQLASLLGGSLVDDNGQPLDDRAVAAIDSQLTRVRRALDAHGMAPGSALALRVFA